MAGMQNLLRALKAVPVRDLPWRKTRDPYKILVSEIMLQQTQVDRVVPFYTRFVRQFPTPQKLAKAPLSKVLKAWQGLGYNRRAVYLQRSAKILRSGEINGTPAQSIFATRLPGVGPYTAAAVEAFAHNKPTIFIETNIRTVFIYHFFPTKKQVSDKELLPLVKQALKKSKIPPREFYARLMDYGTQLKKQGIKLNAKSKHYIKQSRFEGSHRQKRAARLRRLLARGTSDRELERVLNSK